jgi:hypothetical protein
MTPIYLGVRFATGETRRHSSSTLRLTSGIVLLRPIRMYVHSSRQFGPKAMRYGHEVMSFVIRASAR